MPKLQQHRLVCNWFPVPCEGMPVWPCERGWAQGMAEWTWAQGMAVWTWAQGVAVWTWAQGVAM